MREFPPQAWLEYHQHRSEIEGLLDPRCYTISWLEYRLLDGSALAFGNDRAVIVTEVRNYPAGAREIHGLVAAGDLGAIVGLIADAEEWARAQGIEFASIASREGWARVLHDRGYRPHQIELRMEL